MVKGGYRIHQMGHGKLHICLIQSSINFYKIKHQSYKYRAFRDQRQFLNHVEGGLEDHYDIKMLTYLMAVRLAQIYPGAVLQRLDRLVELLRVTCIMKVKANSAKREYEKQDELKRSAIRAISALLMISDGGKNPHLNEFVTQIKNTQKFFIMIIFLWIKVKF